MKKLIGMVAIFGLWLLVFWSFDALAIVTGVIVAVLAALQFGEMLETRCDSRRLINRLMCFIVTLILWMLLFGTIGRMEVMTGVAAAPAVSALFGDVYPDELEKALSPVRWFYFIIYVPFFLYHCVMANFDVAFRVIPPELPIKPGIVKVRTTLKSEMAKTFLANSITLTPGTLTMDIDGDDLYVHWININTEDAQKRTAIICERFEPLLRRIFE